MRRKPACTYNRGRKLAHGLYGCINRVARTPGRTEWLSVNDRNRRSPVVDCVTSVVRRPQRVQEPPYVGFVRIKVGDPDEPSLGVPALSTSLNFISPIVTVTSPAFPSIESQRGGKQGFIILRYLRLSSFRKIEDDLKNFEKLLLMEMYYMYDYLHMNIMKILHVIFFRFNARLIETVMDPDWNKCNSYSEADWTNFYQTHDLIFVFDVRRVK